jgi:hypothetical protein
MFLHRVDSGVEGSGRKKVTSSRTAKIGTGTIRAGPQAARSASEKDARDTSIGEEVDEELQHCAKKTKN